MQIDITKINPEWRDFIKNEMQESYFKQIVTKIENAHQSGIEVFPPIDKIFTAFEQPLSQVKVVILGQDPYHGKGQAHGLAFSVEKGVDIPPSLRNIYQELSTDISGFTIPQHGHLSQWSEQGVFLLNSVLTVESGNANSHANIGWEIFSDRVIEVLMAHNPHLVFILWGKYAQKKGAKIDRNQHCVLESAHPSPLSVYRGFWGSKPFSQTNHYLQKVGKEPIKWQITDN